MTRPTLADSFEKYVFERNSESKLQRVPWQTEFELLNPDDRAIVPSVPLRTDDGRVRIRCEICRIVFSSMRKAAAHLPCRPRSRYRIVKEGFFDFMAKISKLGAPNAEQLEKLRAIILASTSEEASVIACERGDRSAMELTDYRVEWFFCFLSLIPQREIDPRSASRFDRREVRRIQKEFFRSRSGDQEAKWQSQIIREFFEPPRELEQIAKPGVGKPAILLSETELKAFQKNFQKRGRPLAVALERDGVRNALQRYNANPKAFSEWVRPRKEIAVRDLRNGIVPPPR